MSVPVLFAQQSSLGRLAAAFVAAYPDVLLEIEVEDRFVDPVADGFDIVVRVNPSPGSELVGHRFLTDALVVAAAPTVAPPRDAAADVPAVVLTAAREEATWRIETDRGPVELRPRPVLRCSSMMLVRDAVLAGAGAAMMPRRLVEEQVASGALAFWGTVPDRRVEAWALSGSRRLQSARVEAFLAMLSADAASLSGHC